ncbi:MAG TPA: hypothetical protein VGC96_01465 [Candidatus Elarobacter sp.]|jgi:hypothetical protein
MRRIVQSLAVTSVLALAACSGGGSVLSLGSNSQSERVIVTVQGPTNIARVLPGAGLPISAVGVRGSQNGIVFVNRFRWSAAVTTPATSYTANAEGQTRPCGSLTYTPAGGTATPYLPDFGIYIAIDPTNESNIEFIPPTTVPLPAGAPVGSSVGTTFPYCVILSATQLDDHGRPTSAVGSITVAVVNPLSPTQ